MQKFGVKIDLSDFFHDERKFVMILVDPAWENVKFLQHRVEKVFGIDRVRFLTKEGCFIPQEEPIEIIKFINDGLKAFISGQSLEKRRTKHSKSKKNATVEERDSTVAEQQMSAESLAGVKTQDKLKKRKYFSLESGLASRSQNQEAKRSKCVTSAHATMNTNLPIINNKLNEISSTSEQQQFNTVEMEVENTSSKPARRKRQHKNKKAVEEAMESDTKDQGANNTTTSEQSPFSHVVIPSSTPFLTLSDQAKRAASKENRKCKSAKIPKSFPNKIKTFINHKACEGDIVSTTTEQQSDSTEESDERQTGTANSTKVIFRCSLNDVDMSKPRIFQAIKSPIDIQEQLIIAAAYTSTSNGNIADEHEMTEKVEAMVKTVDDEINSIQDDHSHLNSSSVIALDEDETGVEQVSEIIDLNETEYVI